MEKPENVTEEHLVYLDELIESGVTNMFEAAKYLVEEFGMEWLEAKEILQHWMKTLSERQS